VKPQKKAFSEPAPCSSAESPDSLTQGRGAKPLALSEAVQENKKALRRALKNPKAVDQFGRTSLMVAAQAGFEDGVREALAVCDPRAKGLRGETSLTLATRNKNAEIVRMLISVSDIDAQRSDGFTALALATLEGHQELVKLLAPVSDVNILGERGWNPLFHAAENADLESLRALLPRSDARVADMQGNTALHYAAGRSVECVLALLPVSDPLHADENGFTAFRIAVDSRQWSCADRLWEFSPPEVVEIAFRVAGAAKMPRWAAKKEAEEIAAAIAEKLSARNADAPKIDAVREIEKNALGGARKPRAL